MGCLSLNVGALQQAQLSLQPSEQAKLSLRGYNSPEPSLSVSLGVDSKVSADLVALPLEQGSLVVESQQQATLIVGEVCSVSLDIMVVLASTDGPLKTRDGGYILLNPDNENESNG